MMTTMFISERAQTHTTTTTTTTTTSNGSSVEVVDFPVQKCIALNNYGTECAVQKRQGGRGQSNYCSQDAVASLTKAYSLIMSSSSVMRSLSFLSNEGKKDMRMTNDFRCQHKSSQASSHLFDVDALMKVPPSSASSPTVDEDIVGNGNMMYMHPIRIPTLLGECGNGQIRQVVIVAVIFNLALAYHLAAKRNCSSIHQHSQIEQQRTALLLRRAYELYHLALTLQPLCVSSTKRLFQLACKQNLASICHCLHDYQTRDEHLQELVSILVYMTSYKKVHPSTYESFFASSNGLASGSGSTNSIHSAVA